MQAYGTLLANPVYVASINTVGDVILLLAKCSVTAITGIAAVLWFKSNADVHFYAGPLAVVCLFAYCIAHCFFSVYEMAIDTLFLCFAEDSDMADSTGAPMAADDRLSAFMDRCMQYESSTQQSRHTTDNGHWKMTGSGRRLPPPDVHTHKNVAYTPVKKKSTNVTSV